MSYFSYMDGLEALQDPNSLSVQLDRAHKAFRAKYEFERDMADMEERIYQRVLKDVLSQVEVTFKNEASPQIKQLKNELNDLFKQ